MTSACPHCGREDPKAEAVPGNTGASLMLEVPAHLIPALRRVLSVGRATAMMCSAPTAQAGLNDLIRVVDTRISEPVKLFEEFEWAPLLQAAEAGAHLRIEAEETRPWSHEYRIAVTIMIRDDAGELRGGVIRSSGFKTIRDKAAADRLCEALREEIERHTPFDAPPIAMGPAPRLEEDLEP